MRSKITIERHRESLRKGFLSKLNIENWKEYADTKLTYANRNKTARIFTLREYHDLLRKGTTIKQLKNEGYDKHLIFFYNKLLKNEITVSKEEMETDYLDGMSLDEIAVKYKMTRGCVTFLRELYNIKRKGAKYIRRKATEVPLTAQQKELIYGSLMGDGKQGSGNSFSIKHSGKAEEFLLWKYNILKSVASKNSLKKEEYYDERYDSWLETIRFYTHANSDIEEIIYQFYNSGKKKITSEILGNISDFGLAVWYMDDGKIGWNYQSRRRKSWNSQPSIALCTDSFSLEECELMRDWFLSKYRIECYIKEVRRNQHRLKFGTEATSKFLKIVSPHIIPYMQYKISYEHYVKDVRTPEEGKEREIRQCPIGGDFKRVSEKDKDEWITFICQRQLKNKFPYPQLSEDDIDKFLSKLVDFDSSSIKADDSVLFSGYPSSFIQFFHPHIYKMKNKGSLSAFEIFQENQMLRDVIRKMLLEDTYPTKNAIRRGLLRYRGNRPVSVFPYFGAKAVIDHYCTNGKVLDFCSGFGSRMLGAWASDKCHQYIACEPILQTFRGLNDILSKCRGWNPDNKTDILLSNNIAENFLNQFADNSVGLVFTSPPYFNTEIYSRDFSQSCNTYSTYNRWLYDWLFDCIKESIRILKKDGYLILNVANCNPYSIADDTYDFLQKEMNLEVQQHNLYISKTKKEPLFIAKKN